VRVAALPGVQSVGAISLLPLSGQIARIPFTIDGRPVARAQVPSAQYRVVTEAYFHTMGIPLRRGRPFTERDTAVMPPVVIVNETLVHRFFGSEEPLGQRLLLDDTDTVPRVAEIVGVVGDVTHVALDAGPTADIYVPYSQLHDDVIPLALGDMFWVVRTSGDPRGLTLAVRQAMQELDRQVPIGSVRTMDQYLSASVAPRRFNVLVLGVFAAAAVLLAATGIYAMVSFSISQRAGEIAIRTALGAQRRDILTLVVGQGIRPVLVGAGLGLGAALGVTRAMSGLLFGLDPADPGTFVVVSACLVAVGLAACLIPAVRATRV